MSTREIGSNYHHKRAESSTRGLARAERHREWIELRRQGVLESEIASRYGVSQQASSKAVLKYVRDLPICDAGELRRLEAERLDHMFSKLAPAIDRGDLRSIDTAVRISERRSKLLGLDAPKDVRVAVGAGAGIFGMLASSEPIDPETLKAIQALDPIIKPKSANAIPEDAEIVCDADDRSVVETDGAYQAADAVGQANENGPRSAAELGGQEPGGSADDVRQRRKLIFESL